MTAAFSTFRCRLCGSAAAESVYRSVPDRLHGGPGVFDYVRCRQCDLLQIAAPPSNLPDYYQSYRVHRRESLVYGLMRRLLIGSAYLFAPGPGDLLDVGCGNGWYMVEMARRGWRPTGVENDLEHAAQLRKELEMPVVADLAELAGGPETYDLITLNFVFEHLTDPVATLRQVAGLVRPGGRIVITVPNPESREARLFGPRWFHLDPPRHITLFSRAQLGRLLEESGLSSVDAQPVGVPTGLAGSLSYLWPGRFVPYVWYPAIPAGMAFAAIYPDGNFRITAVKPHSTGS